MVGGGTYPGSARVGGVSGAGGVHATIAQNNAASLGVEVRVPYDATWSLDSVQRNLGTRASIVLEGAVAGSSLTYIFPEGATGEDYESANNESFLVFEGTPAVAAVAGTRASLDLTIATGQTGAGQGLRLTMAGTHASMQGADGNDWNFSIGSTIGAISTGTNLSSKLIQIVVRSDGTSTLGEMKAALEGLPATYALTVEYIGSGVATTTVSPTVGFFTSVVIDFTGGVNGVVGVAAEALTFRALENHETLTALSTHTLNDIAAEIRGTVITLNGVQGTIQDTDVVITGNGGSFLLSGTYFAGDPGDLVQTVFAGGVNSNGLEVTVDKDSQTLTVRYDAGTNDAAAVRDAFAGTVGTAVLIANTAEDAILEAPPSTKAFRGAGGVGGVGGGSVVATKSTHKTVLAGAVAEMDPWRTGSGSPIITVAHGLARQPDFYETYIECVVTTSTDGYSMGDRVPNVHTPWRITVRSDGTNTYLISSSTGARFGIADLDAGRSSDDFTASQWKFVAAPYIFVDTEVVTDVAGGGGEDGADGADSTVPGPAGVAGSDGAMGAAGPAGAQGEAGADSTVPGSAGQDGNDGATGATGPQGPQGNAGADSTVPGPAGIAGQDGNDGTDGTDGEDGAAGSGTVVEANPTGTDGDDLTRISIGGTPFNLAAGSGGSGGGFVSTEYFSGNVDITTNYAATATSDDPIPDSVNWALISRGAQGLGSPVESGFIWINLTAWRALTPIAVGDSSAVAGTAISSGFSLNSQLYLSRTTDFKMLISSQSAANIDYLPLIIRLVEEGAGSPSGGDPETLYDGLAGAGFTLRYNSGDWSVNERISLGRALTEADNGADLRIFGSYQNGGVTKYLEFEIDAEGFRIQDVITGSETDADNTLSFHIQRPTAAGATPGLSGWSEGIVHIARWRDTNGDDYIWMNVGSNVNLTDLTAVKLKVVLVPPGGAGEEVALPQQEDVTYSGLNFGSYRLYQKSSAQPSAGLVGFGASGDLIPGAWFTVRASAISAYAGDAADTVWICTGSGSRSSTGIWSNNGNNVFPEWDASYSSVGPDGAESDWHADLAESDTWARSRNADGIYEHFPLRNREPTAPIYLSPAGQQLRLTSSTQVNQITLTNEILEIDDFDFLGFEIEAGSNGSHTSHGPAHIGLIARPDGGWHVNSVSNRLYTVYRMDAGCFVVPEDASIGTIPNSGSFSAGTDVITHYMKLTDQDRGVDVRGGAVKKFNNEYLGGTYGYGQGRLVGVIL